MDQPDRLGGDAVGHGMEARRAQRLQAVRESIEAGPGGELGGQIQGQLRIGDHLAGQHGRVEDDALGVRVLDW